MARWDAILDARKELERFRVQTIQEHEQEVERLAEEKRLRAERIAKAEAVRQAKRAREREARRQGTPIVELEPEELDKVERVSRRKGFRARLAKASRPSCLDLT